MSNDDSRRLILARRARFVAATLAGLGVAVACGGGTESNPQPCLRKASDAGETDADPQVCLSIAPDAGKDGEPRVCLSPTPPDASDDAGDVDAGDGGDSG